jgi:hypothetical protein
MLPFEKVRESTKKRPWPATTKQSKKNHMMFDEKYGSFNNINSNAILQPKEKGKLNP